MFLSPWEKIIQGGEGSTQSQILHLRVNFEEGGTLCYYCNILLVAAELNVGLSIKALQVSTVGAPGNGRKYHIHSYNTIVILPLDLTAIHSHMITSTMLNMVC